MNRIIKQHYSKQPSSYYHNKFSMLPIVSVQGRHGRYSIKLYIDINNSIIFATLFVSHFSFLEWNVRREKIQWDLHLSRLITSRTRCKPDDVNTILVLWFVFNYVWLRLDWYVNSARVMSNHEHGVQKETYKLCVIFIIRHTCENMF